LQPAVGKTKPHVLSAFAFHAFRLFASFAGIGISRSLYAFGVHPLSGLWLAGSACMGLCTPQAHAVNQSLAGPQLAGTWVSLVVFVGNFSGVIGPAVTGFVVDRTGHFFWAFALTAAIACAGAVSYGFFVGPVKPIEWTRSVPT
jgi:MFS family permease